MKNHISFFFEVLSPAAKHELHKIMQENSINPQIEYDFIVDDDCEAFENELVQELHNLLYRTGKEFHIPVPEGYLAGSCGPGWVSWGIGSDLCSAPSTLFAQRQF